MGCSLGHDEEFPEKSKSEAESIPAVSDTQSCLLEDRVVDANADGTAKRYCTLYDDTPVFGVIRSSRSVDSSQAEHFPDTITSNSSAESRLTPVFHGERRRLERRRGPLNDSFRVMLKLTGTLPSIRDMEAMNRAVVEALFEISPAHNICLWSSPDLPDDTDEISAWDREAGPGQKIFIRRPLIEEALRVGLPVVHNDIFENGVFISLAAIPLIAYEESRGVLYLEARGPGARFDDNLVELLNAIGAIAVVGLEIVRGQERFSDGDLADVTEHFKITHDMVGTGWAMQEVFEFIGKVAPKDSTVLITGESGTGKELVAQAIHANSSRANKPFVAINCAALTDTLLESELFGHEKGSFTGAVAQKKGKLETAEGGTVFLDEVGEMSQALQAKVLRVLQEREFERIGGTKTHKLNIRLVAATNRDLREEAKKGQFRQDLFFRLNVLSIHMPPLRTRREDIPALAAFFASKYGAKLARPVAGISRDARAILVGYDWPGNVRELENAIEHAVVLGRSDLILPKDLPPILRKKQGSGSIQVEHLADAIREAKKRTILKALEQTDGNHGAAAQLLDVHPNHLSRLITSLDLRPKRPKG